MRPSTLPTRAAEAYFERLGRLMDLEAEAELERARELRDRLSPAAAEKAGAALVDLAVIDISAGLGGRLLVTLVKRDRTRELPWTRIGVGAPVLLSEQPKSGQRDGGRAGGETSFRGVVASRRKREIVVAVDRLPDDFDDQASWRIDQRKMKSRGCACARQCKPPSPPLADAWPSCAVLLGERPPRWLAPGKAGGEICWFDGSLDASQQVAVRAALESLDVAVIHGPPGTGKTTSVAEVIRQAVARGERVLASAPSHVAVDNILERLVAAGVDAVRLGHPARVAEAMREHTLDLMVEAHDDLRIARQLVKDAIELQRRAARFTRAKPERGAKGSLRAEARELFADARRIEQQTIEHILDSASVVCATTTGLDDRLLGGRAFDLVVIDEAGQSTEPPMWIPLVRAGRLVLAGDHFQLPPTVISPEAAAQGFSISMLERLAATPAATLALATSIPAAAAERPLATRLSVQYRMHREIMDFSSREFYESALVAHDSVAGRRLDDLVGVESNRLTQMPVEWLDTAGAGLDEQLEPDGESRLNPGEARLVARYVGQLMAAGVAADAIAVIAPYAAQVRLLGELLRDAAVEIDSVDGFQGREKEAVIVTMVRSNPEGEIGFLSDTRRMNVALTRARRKLIVIGDSATLAHDPFYGRLLEYVESIGAYRSVWEEDAP